MRTAAFLLTNVKAYQILGSGTFNQLQLVCQWETNYGLPESPTALILNTRLSRLLDLYFRQLGNIIRSIDTYQQVVQDCLRLLCGQRPGYDCSVAYCHVLGLDFHSELFKGWASMTIFWQYMAIVAVIGYPIFDGRHAIARAVRGMIKHGSGRQ